MKPSQDTIDINVEFLTEEDGTSYYVASNDELSLVTDGETFEALLGNLQEALSLVLADDVREDFGLVKAP